MGRATRATGSPTSSTPSPLTARAAGRSASWSTCAPAATCWRQAAVGNELVVYEEYPDHPRFKEGPWHLVPRGSSTGSAAAEAENVTLEQSALGQRLTVTGRVGPARYTQQITLWHGVDRVEFTTWLDEWEGSDQLVRVRFPTPVRGALPVCEVANAVIGRGFGFPDVDSEQAPWTLDNPAYSWCGLSSTARVRINGVPGSDEAPVRRALGVADVVVPTEDDGAARPGAGRGTGPRRRHRHHVVGSRPALRPAPGRLQPARLPGRDRRPGGQRVRGGRAVPRRRRLRGRARPAARRAWPRPAVGAGGQPAGGGVGAQRRPSRGRRAAHPRRGRCHRGAAAPGRARRRGRGPRRRRHRRPPAGGPASGGGPRGPHGRPCSTGARRVSWWTPTECCTCRCCGPAPGGRPACGSTHRPAPPPTAPASSCSTGPTGSTTRW